MYTKENFNFFQKEPRSHFLRECYTAIKAKVQYHPSCSDVTGFPDAHSHNLKWRFSKGVNRIREILTEGDFCGSCSPATSQRSSIESTGQ